MFATLEPKTARMQTDCFCESTFFMAAFFLCWVKKCSLELFEFSAGQILLGKMIPLNFLNFYYFCAEMKLTVKKNRKGSRPSLNFRVPKFFHALRMFDFKSFHCTRGGSNLKPCGGCLFATLWTSVRSGLLVAAAGQSVKSALATPGLKH